VSVELVRIPAGSFVLGDPLGDPDEAPRRAEIRSPFWMSRHEITTAARASSSHDESAAHGVRARRAARIDERM
jgi:formylglycine-generating enzyme required for sulfatase activity